jgi:hypothetical protein
MGRCVSPPPVRTGPGFGVGSPAASCHCCRAFSCQAFVWNCELASQLWRAPGLISPELTSFRAHGSGRAATRVVVIAGRGPLLSRHIQGRHTTRCEQALQRRSTSRPRACTEIARRSVRVQGRPASPLILYRGGFAVGRLSPRRAVFLRQSPRDSARKRGVATASATDNQGLRIACPLYLCDWHMLGAVREQPAFH